MSSYIHIYVKTKKKVKKSSIVNKEYIDLMILLFKL